MRLGAIIASLRDAEIDERAHRFLQRGVAFPPGVGVGELKRSPRLAGAARAVAEKDIFAVGKAKVGEPHERKGERRVAVE